jgi:hypothetical protein
MKFRGGSSLGDRWELRVDSYNGFYEGKGMNYEVGKEIQCITM